MSRHIRFINSLVVLQLITFGIRLPAAELRGWIEEQSPSVDLTATKSLDWIHGGFNGDSTKLNRKAGAGLISALTISAPSNNGALVRRLGATFNWSDGSPDAFCSGGSRRKSSTILARATQVSVGRNDRLRYERFNDRRGHLDTLPGRRAEGRPLARVPIQ